MVPIGRETQQEARRARELAGKLWQFSDSEDEPQSAEVSMNIGRVDDVERSPLVYDMLDPFTLGWNGTERITMVAPDCSAMSWDQVKGASERDARAFLREYRIPVFKIGISTNPVVRWGSKHGYLANGFDKMRVLVASPTLSLVEDIERHLIGLFQDVPGCRNVLRGGDGGLAKRFPNALAYCAYCVAQTADVPWGIGS